MTKKDLARAIELCGSQRALADRIGVMQSNVSYWLKCGRVPAWRERAVRDILSRGGTGK